MAEVRELAILIYERMTALDAIGPYEVLSRLPGVVTKFVAPERGLKRTDQGLGLEVGFSLDEVPAPAILLVPGGPGQSAMMEDQRVLDWIRTAHPRTEWTTSVCTGSLILAGAGILNGLRATTHWLAMEELGRLGAIPVSERVVFDGKLVTAAGVSAGIDMALQLAARISGQEEAESIQLWIEYNPQPPFDSGEPGSAEPKVVERLRSKSRFHQRGRE
jgi:transcriptional regulator GlxA family with amidase domain